MYKISATALYLLILTTLAILPLRLAGQTSDSTALFKGSLDAAVISAKNTIHNNITKHHISPLQVKLTPSIFGENDPLKIVLTMPGIQNNSEGDVGISIRGGGTDQSLISLDDVPIYSPAHLKGFVSSFNSDIISGIDVYTGGFPSKYGSRLSGIVNITSKNGDFEKFHGGITVGLLSSKIHFCGPIINNRTSFIISYRKSYFPLILGPIYENIIKANSEYITQFNQIGYYDLNAGITQKINNSHILDLKFYKGDDIISFIHDNENTSSYIYQDTLKKRHSISTDDEQWGNTAILLRWKARTQTISANTYSYYTRYQHKNQYQKTQKEEQYFHPKNSFIKSITEQSSLLRKSEIEEYSLGSDLTLDSKKNHTFYMGGKISLQNLNPISENSYLEEYSMANKEDSLYSYNTTQGGYYHLLTASIYGEDDITIDKISNISVGIRLTGYYTPNKFIVIPEPRVRGALYITPHLTLKASYSRMSQAIHQLTSSNISSPSDLWVPSTAELPPMISNNITLGLWHEKDYNRLSLVSSIEGYYKISSNNMEYSENYSPINNACWEDQVELGREKNYGIEFNGKIEWGPIISSITYTLSKSIQQFDNINNGNWFYSNQDCRNNLIIGLSYSPFKNFTISSTFYYKTGKRFTMSDVLVKMGSDLFTYFTSYNPNINNMFVDVIWELTSILTYTQRNGYKMEDYHRMDISFDYNIPHKKFGHSNINLSIYNVYNHLNPYKVNITYNVDRGISLKKLCIFPFMPSISYTFEF